MSNCPLLSPCGSLPAALLAVAPSLAVSCDNVDNLVLLLTHLLVTLVILTLDALILLTLIVTLILLLNNRDLQGRGSEGHDMTHASNMPQSMFLLASKPMWRSSMCKDTAATLCVANWAPSVVVPGVNW